MQSKIPLLILGYRQVYQVPWSLSRQILCFTISIRGDRLRGFSLKSLQTAGHEVLFTSYAAVEEKVRLDSKEICPREGVK